jgi:uroporphyrinogen-III synthase
MAILLLTRPEAASARTRAEVERLCPGARIVASPVMEVVPVPAVLDTVPRGLILTSENGAAAGGVLGLPPGMRAWCVGGRTAEVARAAGFDAVSAEGDAEALIRLILSAPEEGPLLHLRGEHARGDIAPRLRAAGCEATDLVAYRQADRDLSGDALTVLAGVERVVLPVYSPRSAEILARQGPFAAPLTVIAISDAARRAAERLAATNIRQIDNPDGQSMLSAIVDSLSD